MPLNWDYRVKGFLFFDWSFKHISNNKLKIQVDPNIDEWINSKPVESQITTMPKELNKQFVSWLQQCNQSLDREFKFMSRLDVMEHDLAAQGNYDLYGKSYFTKLNYGNGQVVLKTGDTVKLPLVEKKAALSRISAAIAGGSSSSLSTAAAGAGYVLNPSCIGFMVGQVVDFEINCMLPADENKYFGKGNVRFLRQPREVFKGIMISIFILCIYIATS